MRRVDAVYCLAYDEETEKVLMVYNKDVDIWSIPGGAVEDGEMLHEAAVREFQEETGLTATIGDIVAVNECFFDSKDGMIKMLYRSLINLPVMMEQSISCGDTSIHKFILSEGKCHIEYINRLEHLEELE